MAICPGLDLSGWSPSPGERTLGGWTAIAFYLASAALCLRAGCRVPGASGEQAPPWPDRVRNILSALREGLWGAEPPVPELRRRAIWFILSGFMVLLGLTRAADLGNLLTAWGRQVAVSQHWYARRRLLQAALILGLGLSATLAIVRVIRREGKDSRLLWVALVGAILDSLFVSARTVSYHYLDALLEATWKGIRLSWIFELGLGGMVAMASAAAAWRGSGPSLPKAFFSGAGGEGNSMRSPLPRPEDSSPSSDNPGESRGPSGA